MRRAATIIVVLVAVAAGFLSSRSHPRPHIGPPTSRPTESAALTEWVFADAGLILRAPSNWHRREQSQTALTIRPEESDGPGKLAKVLTVTAVALDHPLSPPTLDEQVSGVKRVATKNHPEAQYDPIHDITLDGVAAKSFAFTHDLQDSKAKSFRILTINNDKLYLIGLICDQSSADDGQKAFDAIAASVKWTK